MGTRNCFPGWSASSKVTLSAETQAGWFKHWPIRAGACHSAKQVSWGPLLSSPQSFSGWTVKRSRFPRKRPCGEAGRNATQRTWCTNYLTTGLQVLNIFTLVPYIEPMYPRWLLVLPMTHIIFYLIPLLWDNLEQLLVYAIWGMCKCVIYFSIVYYDVLMFKHIALLELRTNKFWFCFWALNIVKGQQVEQRVIADTFERSVLVMF